MKIPETVLIGSIEYKVILEDSLSTKEEVGLIEYQEGLIHVVTKASGGALMPQSRIEHTFIHEYLHGVFDEMQEFTLCSDERFVNQLATHIHKLIEQTQ